MNSIRIFTEPFHGHWLAWFENAPETVFGGMTATESVLRLLEAHGLDPEGIEADPIGTLGNRQAFRLREGDCSDCGGSGQYVGLAVVEPCRACGGAGVEIPY